MSLLSWALFGVVVVLALGVALVLVSAVAWRVSEATVRPLGAFVEVGGVRLHYLDRGTGPAVVMIHGLGGQMRNFGYLLDHVADERRVVLVDRPGAGHSGRLAGVSTGIRAQAAAIAGLIDLLGLERPLVVGHSLGGAVALALALDHPRCVGGLALIAPLTQPQEFPPDVFRHLAIRSPAWRWLFSWTVAVPLSLLVGERGRLAVFAPGLPPIDFLTAGGGALIRRPHSVYAASTDMTLVNEDLIAMSPRYASLDLPVRVLYGRQDGILDPRVHGERLAATVPGLRLDMVDGGHMILVTAPVDVAQWIKSAEVRR